MTIVMLGKIEIVHWIGEIYNRRELGFAGDDAEAVAAAYAKWGVDAFARFRGAFAVALDDGSKTILFEWFSAFHQVSQAVAGA